MFLLALVIIISVECLDEVVSIVPIFAAYFSYYFNIKDKINAYKVYY